MRLPTLASLPEGAFALTEPKRLIFLFLMPGDFIIPGLFELECCDLIALTALRTADASPLLQCEDGSTARTTALIRQSGRYYRLFLLDHLTRLTGGDTARAVAHMLYEFYVRAGSSGACAEGQFHLPIGQRVINRALGRSSVEVNKVISLFQTEGLLDVGYDWIKVCEPDGLRRRAGKTHSLDRPARPNTAVDVAA
ncbi:Crp/Fnr family transcriptional regulator [Sphingomonas ginkgonis]|uniref:Crp/Fnr family transcriptional regulator n=1 Tax=Sphingomonas ginkgonis TaxID=2315330 RepID=A0A429VBC0_9SPHN|nr:helix-turn-helix domain-containing protein [Sphingomonas ginkgonis]RST31293.1 Crp/Fnr family transcriptional regulator [Sphingomonas ginkgonis]